MVTALKWLVPVAVFVGAIAYLQTYLPAPGKPDANKPELTTSGYQLPPAALSTGQKEPIHVDEAFKLTMNAASAGVISARFEVKSNYYLYRNKIKITGPDGAALTPTLPPSKTKRDEHFGESQVFDESFVFTVPLAAESNGEVTVNTSYQGCEDKGICYPPVTKQFVINVSAAQ